MSRPSVQSLVRSSYTYARILGLDVRKAYRNLRYLPAFVADLKELRRQAAASEVEFPFAPLHPCLGEAEGSGTAKGHYFHQDLLVARRIWTNSPRRHIDVGSRVDGFVAHVAAFREIEVIDIRPPPGVVTNVKFIQADLMDPASSANLQADSVSCLHALEHFGLGRYGDPIDFTGYRRGYENLRRLVAPKGMLYLSVPIGPQRIEFNAHRVFSVSHLLSLVTPNFDVERFSFVDDKGDLHEDVPLDAAEVERNFGCRYGCGILELRSAR